MTDHTPRPFFENGPIRNVYLPQWMEWASGKDGADHAVVLPMIQRGSVWTPHKLMDLWDTLLRDMPVGALMASVQTGQTVIPTGQSQTRQAKANDIGLIDGQQRTLAMMVGWTGLPDALRPVALWVDVAEAPQGEYRFRLWATTRSQPFGYEKASAGGQPVSKLARHKLRQVNHLWREKDQSRQLDAQTLWKTPGFMPWESTLALPLPEVMACNDEAALQARVEVRKQATVDWLKSKLVDLEAQSAGKEGQELDFLNGVRDQLKKRLKDIASATGDDVQQRVKALIAARHKVAASQFPVIQVHEAHFANEVIDDKDSIDPPLAILFKRVGTGGVPLSDADYVYAVIKHLAPDVHDMVEAMLKFPRIQAIYTATSLVMSAVRVTVLAMGETEKTAVTDSDGANAGLNDTARMDKAAFARLVRKHPGFVAQFRKYIQPDGAFQTGLNQVLDSLAYEPDTFTEGLPKHALCLVQIPLLETLLAWQALNKPAVDALLRSRLAMVRFVLQGYLCVLDPVRASEVMVKALKEGIPGADDEYPDQALLNPLLPSDTNNSPLAHALPSPDTLKRIPGLTVSDKATGLRGWQRFDIKTDTQKMQHAQLYKRWWNRSGGHVHPMLLWLQRDYVFKQFESKPAMAGMDDETPFDYDHLVPSAHWAGWTGEGQNPGSLTAFEQDGKGSLGYTGNCIGNLHVLESSENRSRGDTPLASMLKHDGFARNGLVSGSDEWMRASPDDKVHRTWTKERALDFQAAVEQRAFALYKKFYSDLQCTGV